MILSIAAIDRLAFHFVESNFYFTVQAQDEHKFVIFSVTVHQIFQVIAATLIDEVCMLETKN